MEENSCEIISKSTSQVDVKESSSFLSMIKRERERDLVCFQTWKNFRNGRERSKKDDGRYSRESGAWLHFDYERFWKSDGEIK